MSARLELEKIEHLEYLENERLRHKKMLEHEEEQKKLDKLKAENLKKMQPKLVKRQITIPLKPEEEHNE